MSSFFYVMQRFITLSLDEDKVVQVLGARRAVVVFLGLVWSLTLRQQMQLCVFVSAR